jgi:uncharacterized protein (TIGR00730 family)
MKSILVFCGSGVGNDEQIIADAKLLGKLMAENSIRLVYGAGNLGLMGLIANEALANGGKVTGVIPKFMMDKELAHKGLTELHVVDTMHKRKQKMAELSDAVITLPGGIGTMEELFEFYTWLQLQLHHKPIGILNTNGFYTFLIKQLEEMVSRKFLMQDNLNQLLIESDPTTLLNKMLKKDQVDSVKDFYDKVKKLG